MRIPSLAFASQQWVPLGYNSVMTLLTRTGLLEGRRKPVDRCAKARVGVVDVAPLCQAAPYSLRPLAALLNPYARGCSVLCNHPSDTADTHSRDALRRVKETWPTERVLAGEDALPEELFRRYTDTDSRPHSPTHHSMPLLVAPPPTAGTTTSMMGRRCRTPDPYHPFHLEIQQQQQQQKSGQPQRTLLVLDLRRSRSHDTLSIAAPSDSSIWPPHPGLGGGLGHHDQVHGQPPFTTVSPPTPSEALPARRLGGLPGGPHRRTPRTPCPSLAASRPASQAAYRAGSRAGNRMARPSSQPTSPSPGSHRGKLQTAASVGGEVMGTLEPPPLAASSPIPANLDAPDVVVTCADDSRAEEEVVRRRGKKRRGKKSGKDALRETEKEIHGFPEPGETQVSAIGDESHNPSARPSLTGAGLLSSGGSVGAWYGQGVAAARAAAEEAARLRAVDRSFLDADNITHLQRDLDLETVECEFDEKRRVALEEAFRLLPSHAKRRVRDRIPDDSLSVAPAAPAALAASNVADGSEAGYRSTRGALLDVPRVFSLRSARFELPLNSTALNHLTPMEYVTKHVEVSGSSAQLYRRVFNLHREGANTSPIVPCAPGAPAAPTEIQQPPPQQQQQQQQPETSQLLPPPEVLLADFDDKPRYLLGECVTTALGDVLGRPLTAEEAKGLRERLGWVDEERLSFRTWCGVCALSERLFAHRAEAEAAVGNAEPPTRPELEQADLAGLQRRLARLNPDPRLARILSEMAEL